MLFTDVQRSVRLNKKKKSTNTFPYPDEIIDRLARAFYPAILACWNSEEARGSLPRGRREIRKISHVSTLPVSRSEGRMSSTSTNKEQTERIISRTPRKTVER